METEELTLFHIRDMATDDLGEVSRIEGESFSKPWSESLFYGQIHNDRSFARVAESGDRIVGYVCGNYVLDEGHILTLAVDESYRCKGIASALVSDLIEEMKLKGCLTIFLEVRSSNSAALRMYEKFCFRMIGTRKNYYISPQEDAVIMMRHIIGNGI